MISHRPAIRGERLVSYLPDRRTNTQTYSSPHIGYIGAASEDELGSVTGSASRLLTEHRNSTEELSRTKTNGKEKTKGFSKFNLSLTAPPPKSKPKQPGQVPAPVVSCPPLRKFCLYRWYK